MWFTVIWIAVSVIKLFLWQSVLSLKRLYSFLCVCVCFGVVGVFPCRPLFHFLLTPKRIVERHLYGTRKWREVNSCSWASRTIWPMWVMQLRSEIRVGGWSEGTRGEEATRGRSSRWTEEMLGDTHCGEGAHNCQCTRLNSAFGPFYKQTIRDESHWGMQVGTPQKKKCSLTEVSVVRRFTSTFDSLHHCFTTTSCVVSHSLKAPRDESSQSLYCSASSERLC